MVELEFIKPDKSKGASPVVYETMHDGKLQKFVN